VSGENYIITSLMSFTGHQIFSGDKIDKNEMGGASSVNGGDERCIQGFGRVT